MTLKGNHLPVGEIPEVLVLVAAALPWEARTALAGLRVARSGQLTIAATDRGLPVAVVVTGMGPDHAGRAIAAALERVRPQAILSIGCAGALDPDLRPGDVTVASEIRSPGAPPLAVDPGWRALLERAAERAGSKARTGAFESRAEILATAADKLRARASSGAIAVEMEATALAAAARRAGLPFAAIRTIIDAADTEIVFVRELVAPDGRLRIGAILAALLRGRSQTVRELRGLAAARGLAARSLTAVIRELWGEIPAVANHGGLG